MMFMPGLACGSPGAQAEVEFARTSLASAQFGDARLRGTENRLSVQGPLRQTGDVQFSWALDYAYQRYEYEGLVSRNRDLHRLEVPLSWRGEAAYSWTAELRPVVASSSNVFKEFWSRGSADDFMLHGRALFGRSAGGPRWGWHLGAARDDAFGGESVYPVFALLREHGGLQMEIGWPVSRAMLAAGRGFESGGELAPVGNRWHIVSDERDGARFDYETRAWRAGGIVRWRSSRGLVLTSRAGIEIERRHRFEDDEGAVVNRAVGETRYFEFAVGYRW